MITLNDIVNSAASKVDGTLVLHRSMSLHPTFKIYKVYRYKLYHIKDGVKRLLFTFEENVNCTLDDIEKAWEKCDKLYLTKFIEWITGNEYKSLIDGV